MKITKHPYRYNYKSLFSKLETLKRFEGGIIYKAIKSGKYYLIVDEGTLADFLDEEDWDELIKIIEFESELEFGEYLKMNYDFK